MKVVATLLERKKELHGEIEAALEELRAIEIALGAFQNISNAKMVNVERAQADLFAPKPKRKTTNPTIKQMIVLVLEESESGLDAWTILNEINSRWQKDLARTSLSPQLSRLKHEGILIYVNQKWLLAKKDEAPDVLPSEARVGETPQGSLSKSTTIPTTGPSLQGTQSRKEEES